MRKFLIENIYLNVAIHSNECDIILTNYQMDTFITNELFDNLHRALYHNYKFRWELFNNFKLYIYDQNIRLIKYSNEVVELSDELANEFVNRLYELLRVDFVKYMKIALGQY